MFEGKCRGTVLYVLVMQRSDSKDCTIYAVGLVFGDGYWYLSPTQYMERVLAWALRLQRVHVHVDIVVHGTDVYIYIYIHTHTHAHTHTCLQHRACLTTNNRQASPSTGLRDRVGTVQATSTKVRDDDETAAQWVAIMEQGREV